MENDWTKEIKKLKAEIKHLKNMLEETEKLVTELRRDRDFYRNEIALKGGDN